ncbi:hypothetical protein [Kutzneria albida]|uniref:Uncharacterized protein n=1 Tax=Kutzneria albida DSM 43870 TaxID=1449976 RepID=W5WBW2_9PSEU|nr:hypothetical protein [Kutzneria albida]AHH98041.1 hypothetical protein KALB_4679 [Kutzneria albida DSM 43870]
MTSKNVRSALWIVGLLCLVQGFGSALTEVLWHTSFGVSGILIGLFGAPTWISWVIGVLGAVLLAWAAFGAAASRRA